MTTISMHDEEKFFVENQIRTGTPQLQVIKQIYRKKPTFAKVLVRSSTSDRDPKPSTCKYNRTVCI